MLREPTINDRPTRSWPLMPADLAKSLRMGETHT